MFHTPCIKKKLIFGLVLFGESLASSSDETLLICVACIELKNNLAKVTIYIYTS